jgi:hypothetical protein
MRLLNKPGVAMGDSSGPRSDGSCRRQRGKPPYKHAMSIGPRRLDEGSRAECHDSACFADSVTKITPTVCRKHSPRRSAASRVPGFHVGGARADWGNGVPAGVVA